MKSPRCFLCGGAFIAEECDRRGVYDENPVIWYYAYHKCSLPSSDTRSDHLLEVFGPLRRTKELAFKGVAKKYLRGKGK